jgi:hypothetical protein
MDNEAPTAVESTHESLQAMQQNLPALMQLYRNEIAPIEQAKLGASQGVSEAYQQLLADIYKKTAPQLAQTGRDIDTANRLNNANIDAQILAGPGKQLAQSYSEIDKQLNPEYYKTREATSGKLQTLLNSINLDAPNIEAERLINQENVRSGNQGNASQTNTVANALQFGNENTKRQATLSNAINTATGFMQGSSNAQFNPATTILNRPTSNTGVSQFGGVQQAGDQAFNSGGGLLNAISGFQNNAMQINANRRDIMDRTNEGVTAVGSL